MKPTEEDVRNWVESQVAEYEDNYADWVLCGQAGANHPSTPPDNAGLWQPNPGHAPFTNGKTVDIYTGTQELVEGLDPKEVDWSDDVSAYRISKKGT